MKRRMKPREPPPRAPVHPKDRLDIEVRQNKAINEMMGKQNQGIVDQIRRSGKASTNMLMRIAMMDDNPIFANGRSLPSSLTTNSFAQSGYPETIAPPAKPSPDLVSGGSGENVYFVSRGVVPSVIPAKYAASPGLNNPMYPTTMNDSYPDHPKQLGRLISATNAGQAQSKDWALAAARKHELEHELDALDSQIRAAGNAVQETSSRHGLLGRPVGTGSFKPEDGKLGHNNSSSSLIPGTELPLKGLTAVGGTTMKDTYKEYAHRRRVVYTGGKAASFLGNTQQSGMSYSILADEAEDADAPLLQPKRSDLQTIGKFRDVRIPHDPAGLAKKKGSEICGSSFRWKDTVEKSTYGEEFSWPADKNVTYDHDKEEVVEDHQYGSYAISKTRYGDCAKELDLGKSVYVKSLKERKRHAAKDVSRN